MDSLKSITNLLSKFALNLILIIIFIGHSSKNIILAYVIINFSFAICSFIKVASYVTTSALGASGQGFSRIYTNFNHLKKNSIFPRHLEKSFPSYISKLGFGKDGTLFVIDLDAIETTIYKVLEQMNKNDKNTRNPKTKLAWLRGRLICFLKIVGVSPTSNQKNK